VGPSSPEIAVIAIVGDFQALVGATRNAIEPDRGGGAEGNWAAVLGPSPTQGMAGRTQRPREQIMSAEPEPAEQPFGATPSR
jgi:hypothetical protein